MYLQFYICTDHDYSIFFTQHKETVTLMSYLFIFAVHYVLKIHYVLDINFCMVIKNKLNYSPK